MSGFIRPFAAAVLCVAGGGVQALTITAGTDAAALARVLLAPGSGVAIVPGSATYQGAATQGGTYSGLTLSNSVATVANADGVVLTSGDVRDIPGNDSESASANPGAGSDADLQSIAAQTVTADANVLAFAFTVPAGRSSVALDFTFASDEYPNQGVTDVFGVFVDGVNYAAFADGSLISFDMGSPAAKFFNDNDAGGPDPFVYAGGTQLEYDGIVDTLTVVGVLDPHLAVHWIKIAIGDTWDTRYDSGVFVAGLHSGNESSGGIGTGAVPLSPTLPLLVAAVTGLGFFRRVG